MEEMAYRFCDKIKLILTNVEFWMHSPCAMKSGIRKSLIYLCGILQKFPGLELKRFSQTEKWTHLPHIYIRNMECYLVCTCAPVFHTHNDLYVFQVTWCHSKLLSFQLSYINLNRLCLFFSRKKAATTTTTSNALKEECAPWAASSEHSQWHIYIYLCMHILYMKNGNNITYHRIEYSAAC